jgi:hypothetical protein
MQTMGVRLIAVVVVAALVAGGPLAPLAAAEQRPRMSEDDERVVKRAFRLGPDMYDLLGVLMTIGGAPPKAAVCVLGVFLGTTLFFVTLGSADRASAAVMREGCAQNWLVSGKDIRPDPTP